MSQVDIVPRWLIYKSVYRGGVRLPKFVKLVKPIAPRPVYPLYPEPGVEGMVGMVVDGSDKHVKHINNRHTFTLTDKNIKFKNWEYRFWAIEFMGVTPMCAECRCCGQCLALSELRLQHPNINECFKKLITAYSLLLKDMRCVICDKQTKYKAWGVPICKTVSCLDHWMHVDAKPIALNEALRLSQQQGIVEA